MITPTPPPEAARPTSVPLRLLHICQPCLDGVGAECHTAGCALFLHRVDLPVHKELYQTFDKDPAMERDALRVALEKSRIALEFMQPIRDQIISETNTTRAFDEATTEINKWIP